MRPLISILIDFSSILTLISDSMNTKQVKFKEPICFRICGCLGRQRDTIVLCLLVLVLSSFAFSQDGIVRVSTDLVRVPVAVFDRDGRFVPALTKSDFKLFENGIQQEISYFETVESPFSVLVLCDVSGSMTLKLDDLSAATNMFVKNLRRKDTVAIATFAEKFHVVRKGMLVENFRFPLELKQWHGEYFTRLFDAIDDSFNYLDKFKGKKAVVVFTDAAGDGTYGSIASNLRRAQENEATVYTIQYEMEPVKYVNESVLAEGLKKIAESNEFIKDIADITGGRTFRIKDIRDLKATFGLIAAELGQQYELGFYPRTDGTAGELRELKVRVLRPDIAVRARTSYMMTKDR